MTPVPDPVISRDGPGYRDTAAGLGRLLPPPQPATSCPGCHRLADVIDMYRKAERLNEAEIAALTAEVTRLRNRYERPQT